MNKLELFFIQVAEVSSFIGRVFLESFTPPFEWKEVIRQCYKTGYKSMSILAFVSLIAGFVFTKQSAPVLEDFGEDALLPGLVAIGIVRSLGPLIGALVCAGKLGSSIGAELSSMNVSEQIEAMDISGTNPFRFLVVTRVIAVSLMMPILVIYADFMCLLGGFLFVSTTSQMSFDLYFLDIFDAITIQDMLTTFIKPFFFGLGISLVSTFAGYNSSKAAEGVGRAANISVVYSMVTMFIIDFVSIQVVQILNRLTE